MKAANVRPITELKNRTKELLQEVSDGGQPVVITQNGKPKVVLMDVGQHDRLQETLAMLKLLAQSQDDLAKTGRAHSSAEARRRAKAALRGTSVRK
ncbi:MAG TPA: type II toxin-antitoxin system Phd/YefM family antitoxin [Polyangia bacterium]|jgi:prevent-host-death family protein|nr:type II toxin-antitoxin system Phd/YefM family antitoxin [Polyangia bacterium]